MVDCKVLSDDDLSLAIDRAHAAIEGQRMIIAQIRAAALDSLDSAKNRELVDTHVHLKEKLASNLRDLEAERLRRQ